ncbi:MAG: type II toxin-antitoxin system prevent-host-death family antitoxin [Actinobacteria bacterium]|nr:type II toxin-antitoxin system prevent-host-death family antitoxin [Actinomycetota bacterium]
MTIIGLKELRQNASQIAERAQKGERFIVVKRSKPVFSIGPPPNEKSDVADWLEDYTKKNHDLLTSLSEK